ncbi:hypothetical protein SAMN04488032_1314 [Pacificibacter marinus]|uniref:Uncharacterized protein n=1 Tax=Pacificibacter marinus TaxID=658057 RepID=A0A1Y5TST1_9RHOB|nr:hypothetical protein SAMN04488032_1314 [Pacificibacter marinus]SLN71153.1 hypothetical protein PAM7971_03815 [Pacificibacter marinus]
MPVPEGTAVEVDPNTMVTNNVVILISLYDVNCSKPEGFERCPSWTIKHSGECLIIQLKKVSDCEVSA